MKKRYIIWGCGKYGAKALELLGRENVDFYCDSLKSRTDSEYLGVPLIGPDELINYRYDHEVLVSVSKASAVISIENQLISMGVTYRLLCNYRSITEGPVWDKAYNLDNYDVEYTGNDNVKEKVCAIYFSSSSVYFPNDNESLEKSIIQDDYYEWKKHRIKRASKHIFVRDVSKNFYVIGINNRLSSIDKLIDMLAKETIGYSIITVGSSGGAYMAALAGALLGAEKCISFSTFWNLNLINVRVWHLIGKYASNPEKSKYYDIVPFIHASKHTVFIYIYPRSNSDEINNDSEQSKLVQSEINVISIPIDSSKHGVCISEEDLDKLLNQ